MNRERLAATALAWIQLEAFSAQTRFVMLAMWIEAIIDLADAIGALVEGRNFAALRFAEMVRIDPASHRPPRLYSDGPRPVTLADLRDAMALIRARPA